MTIESIISAAIEKLRINDETLINEKMEWATAHRLAVYLEGYFPGWNIDCEYIKMGEAFETKRGSQGSCKRPDIVIHKRGRLEKENNLLVIEIKMGPGNDLDEEKLIDFTSKSNSNRLFQYQKGLKITFLPVITLKWFENGHKVSPDSAQ